MWNPFWVDIQELNFYMFKIINLKSLRSPYLYLLLQFFLQLKHKKIS